MRLQDAWVLTDYADVDMVLRDSQRFGNVGRDFGYIPQVSVDPHIYSTRRADILSRPLSSLRARRRLLAFINLDEGLSAPAQGEAIDAVRFLFPAGCSGPEAASLPE